jgi:predicted PurR-regulated permease PerM
MSRPATDHTTFSRAFLLLLLVFISVLFVQMIRGFLLSLLLAAIGAGLTQPLYRRLERAFRGRRTAAGLVSLVLVVVVVVTPLLGLLGVVAAQAVSVGQSAGPWVKSQLNSPSDLEGYLHRLPFYERVEPYRGQILERLGELASGLSQFLVNGLSAATRGTVGFIFQFFIMLYAMYFFLIDGGATLTRLTSYVPLPEKDVRTMLEKFVSVSRATLKGTLAVGVVQGGLGGLAFAVVGIQGAVFWGTVMTVLSIIPAVGTGLVWVPAAIYLVIKGQLVAGIGLGVWCLIVVGSVDNLLRPILVGRDTKMPDLLILLSTLGGLSLFGLVGFVIGPVVAALFLSVWEIYRAEFSGYLSSPDGEAAGPASPTAPPDPGPPAPTAC